MKRRSGGQADRRTGGQTTRRSVDPSIRRSAGFTLVEILVVLTVLAIAVSVVGLSAAALDAPVEAEVPRRLAEARTDAIRTGQPITLEFTGGVGVTLYPDGSATPARIWDGEGSWRVDPWTGEARRE